MSYGLRDVGKASRNRVAKLCRRVCTVTDQATANEGGLVRAADLIGQLADPNYLRKQNALFHELVETGSAEKLALSSPADLSEGYVAFFWKQIEPYIGDALRYLALTAEGRQWTANLYAQVFTVEHHRWHMVRTGVLRPIRHRRRETLHFTYRRDITSSR